MIGNRYDMVLIAAMRARILKLGHKSELYGDVAKHGYIETAWYGYPQALFGMGVMLGLGEGPHSPLSLWPEMFSRLSASSKRQACLIYMGV